MNSYAAYSSAYVNREDINKGNKSIIHLFYIFLLNACSYITFKCTCSYDKDECQFSLFLPDNMPDIKEKDILWSTRVCG